MSRAEDGDEVKALRDFVSEVAVEVEVDVGVVVEVFVAACPVPATTKRLTCLG